MRQLLIHGARATLRWVGLSTDSRRQDSANQLRRRRPRPGDTWHRDEVLLTLNGKRQYLWHAVDQDDNVLDIGGQRRRTQKAAKKFCTKLLKGVCYVPHVLITDKLQSYAA